MIGMYCRYSASENSFERFETFYYTKQLFLPHGIIHLWIIQFTGSEA